MRTAVTGIGSGGAGELASLRRQNTLLRERLALAERQGARGRELDRLLRVADAGRYPIVPAQVIAVGNAVGFDWTVTIDAGRRDGVQAGLTVLDGDGLVGRVIAANSTTATVLLAVDPTSNVGIRLAGSNEIGYTTGQGQQPLLLTLLSATATIRPGDRVVTAGTSPGERPYVAGVPVGRVSAVRNTPGALTRTALVTPYVDATALDLLGVVVVPARTVPRQQLAPGTLPTAPAGGTR